MEITWPNGRIVFDTSDEEVVESTVTVTEHPIEGGGVVTDHVIKNASRLRFRATVSNTPIREPETHMRGVGGRVRSADLGSATRQALNDGAQSSNGKANAATYEEETRQMSANVLQFDGEFDRVSDIYFSLLGLQDNRQLFTVTTRLSVWENCLLETLSAPRDATTGDAMEFSFEVLQLTFANSQIVDAPEPREPRGQRQRSRGSQNAEESEPEDRRSAWARGTDLLADSDIGQALQGLVGS